MRLPFTAGPDDGGRRLEAVLRRLLPGQTLGTLQKALRQGDIRLNGAKTSADARVAAGDRIEIWEVLAREGLRAAPAPGTAGAEPVPEDWILFESADLLAVNKPSGLVVHRGEGGGSGGAPLDDRVRTRLGPSADSLSFRPGPLHRLDRETSGIVVFSKTLAGARDFSAALAGRRYTKTYLAVLRGRLDGEVRCSAAVSRDEARRTSRTDGDGDAAESLFRPLAHAPGLTLAEVDLGTGRTHQIRVHAASLGHPLAGDGKYGGGPAPEGLAAPFVLHAWKLSGPLLPALEAPPPPACARWLTITFKFPL